MRCWSEWRKWQCKQNSNEVEFLIDQDEQQYVHSRSGRPYAEDKKRICHVSSNTHSTGKRACGNTINSIRCLSNNYSEVTEQSNYSESRNSGFEDRKHDFNKCTKTKHSCSLERIINLCSNSENVTQQSF